MYVTPMNPNTIVIQPVPSGCCKFEFDSTYPIHLNGIIRQDEFQQSITNINSSISSRKALFFCIILSIVLFIVGMALFIAGPISAVSSKSYGFPVLVGVGFGLFFLGMIVLMCGLICIQVQRGNKMRQAIAAESAKYSTRSPKPCSWRLDSTTVWAGGYQRRRTVINRILIEIGGPADGGFGVGFNNPTFVASQPPPYSAFENLGFCSRCGIARVNRTDKFCPSCGQMFNV